MFNPFPRQGHPQPPTSLTLKMRPPPILISDHTSLLAPTLLYIDTTNTLDLRHTYTQIQSLSSYAKRSSEFLDLFWSSAAHLLDYFADFLVIDKPAMQSIWFNMLDIWRRAGESSILTLEECDSGEEFSDFTTDFKATLRLMRRTISGIPTKGLQKSLIPPSTKSSLQTANPGTFISGLLPWAQFLSAGSPGYPPTKVSNSNSNNNNNSGTTPEGPYPVPNPPRHVPMPAISIIHRHTARTHALAASLDADLVPALHHHSLHLPQPLQKQTQTQTQTQTPRPHDAKTHTYTSSFLYSNKITSYRLTAMTTTTSPSSSNPPIRRYQGYADPSLLVESPGWRLIDECVGLCKGVEAYVAAASGDGEEVEQGEEEQEGRSTAAGFDMWTVWEGTHTGLRGRGEGEVFGKWVG